MDDNQERMEASVNAWRKETTVCQKAMETCLESKEPTPVEIESIVEHEALHKEEAEGKIEH
jgi:hypothetical protein